MNALPNSGAQPQAHVATFDPRLSGCVSDHHDLRLRSIPLDMAEFGYAPPLALENGTRLASAWQDGVIQGTPLWQERLGWRGSLGIIA